METKGECTHGTGEVSAETSKAFNQDKLFFGGFRKLEKYDGEAGVS